MSIRPFIPVLSTVLLTMAPTAWSANVDIPNTFVSGEAAVAAEVNENFSSIETAVDDNNARIETAEGTLNQAVNDVSTLQNSVNTLEALHPGDLTQIEYLNWQHNGEMTVSEYLANGIVVWFSNDVVSETLIPPNHNYHVQLFQLGGSGDWQLEFDINMNEVSDVSVDGDSVITGFTPEADLSAVTVQGIQIIRISGTLMDSLGTYKVVIRGDFITDVNGRAVDGNFLLAETPSGDRIEGGTFESIFRVVPD